MPILKLVLRRLALGVVTLVVVSLAVFALSQILPSDPARAVLGREATPESLTAFREKHGLDQPAASQYVDWVKGLLRGEPGISYSNDQPVMTFLGDRIKNSLFLMVAGSLISIPLSLVLGSYAALRRDKVFDNTNSVVSLVLAAMPEFVVGRVRDRAAGDQRLARAARHRADPAGHRTVVGRQGTRVATPHADAGRHAVRGPSRCVRR